MVRQLLTRVLRHQMIQERPYVVEFTKFAVVGVSNTVVDFTVYFILTRFVPFFERADHFLFANIISFSVAVTNSFFWNKRWTFPAQSRSPTQFPKFILVNCIGLGINETALFVLVRWFGLFDLLAKALAIGASMLANFLMSRAWVFRSTPPLRETSDPVILPSSSDRDSWKPR